jgi:hypothetical protein
MLDAGCFYFIKRFATMWHASVMVFGDSIKLALSTLHD